MNFQMPKVLIAGGGELLDRMFQPTSSHGPRDDPQAVPDEVARWTVEATGSRQVAFMPQAYTTLQETEMRTGPFSPRRARSDTKVKRSRTDAKIPSCVVFTHQPTRFQPLAPRRAEAPRRRVCKMSKNTRLSAITMPYYHVLVGMQAQIYRWFNGRCTRSASGPTDGYARNIPFLRWKRPNLQFDLHFIS